MTRRPDRGTPRNRHGRPEDRAAGTARPSFEPTRGARFHPTTQGSRFEPTRGARFHPTTQGSRFEPTRGARFELTHGLHAGLAIFERRREDIERVAHSRALRDDLRHLIRWADSNGVERVEAADGELDRMAESTHHEGLCIVARPRAWSPIQAVGDLLLRQKGAAVALDRVRNPYNVGAILRTAAFFGVDAMILGAPAPSPDLTPTVVRVAEGGAEDVRLARTTDLADSLARLRERGARVVGADARAPADARRFTFDRPCVLVVGNERDGLSPRVRAQCDALVGVRGRSQIDSLNVAVAAGVLIAALCPAS